MAGVRRSGGADVERVAEMAAARRRNRQLEREKEKVLHRNAEVEAANPPLRPRPSSMLLSLGEFTTKDPHTVLKHPQVQEGWRNKWVLCAAAMLDALRMKKWVEWALIFVAQMLVMPTIFKGMYCNNFADQRLLFLGIPNTLNVISSISFSVAGLGGIILCYCKNYYVLCSRLGLLILFVGATAIGFGSSYYHLNPKNASLVCDTLTVFIAFASAVAIFSIEDGARKKYWLWAAGFYLLARVGHVADEPIYRWTLQNFSGHTFEHLCDTMVLVALNLTVARRRPTVLEPESHRITKYHLLRQFMQSLTSYVVFCFVEGFATMIEIIIVLWDFGASLVTCSEKENLARQMVPQHVGVWGMDNYKSKAHDFLESELLEDSALGLWGTSGVGKTRFLFLMIECYANGDSLFRHILPIQDGSVTDTQHCLAVILKLDWETMASFEEHHRAEIISDYLKHDSFLVLLDDVEDRQLDLASVGLPMPFGGRRKLIVTSTSQAGCSFMGCTEANTIEMKCLGEEDAWNLFKYNAGVEITEADVEVHKIAKQMVSACEGFPRAISAIGLGMAGATLCGTAPDDWWYAYELFKAKNLPPERMEEIWAVLV